MDASILALGADAPHAALTLNRVALAWEQPQFYSEEIRVNFRLLR